MLEAQQLVLRRELADVGAPASLFHPNVAELYRQRVEHLHEAPCDDSTRNEAFDLIRSLTKGIHLAPSDGQLRINLRGELAGILALAANKGKLDGPSANGLAEQIKMVAGVGFEPTTFRL